MLAGRSDLQPARTAILWPKASQKRGGKVEDKSYRTENRWKAGTFAVSSLLPFLLAMLFLPHGTATDTLRALSDYITKRLDTRPMTEDDEHGEFMVPVKFTLRKLALPLIDVFCPPTTAVDDIQWPEEESLDDYLNEWYKKDDEMLEEEKFNIEFMSYAD
jgi:hypothetical protein